jgi:hypothetical protein
MTNVLEIIWCSLAILSLVGFFVVMYLGAEKIYYFNIRIREENKLLFKIIGSNERYLNERDKWIRHYRMYLAFIALLSLSIIIPFIIIIYK